MSYLCLSLHNSYINPVQAKVFLKPGGPESGGLHMGPSQCIIFSGPSKIYKKFILVSLSPNPSSAPAGG